MQYNLDNHQTTMNLLSHLESRCAVLRPRSESVAALCLGLHMTTYGDYPSQIMRMAGDETNMRRLIAILGGGSDVVQFLFRRATMCLRWQAWAVLVLCEPATWKRFVRETPHGRAAVKDLFRYFHVMPANNPEKQAWCETDAVAPHHLYTGI